MDEQQWAVECRGVSVSFTGEVCEVEGADLLVKPGEFASLVGPSGCGKSTLLRVIAGLLTPTKGEASVFGQSGSPWEREVGFVFQDPTLLAWRTAAENVALPLEIHNVSRQERLAIAHQALRDVGLGDHARQKPAQMSGGMRQRVSLARALVGHCRVLLLDEPFAAVDALRRERFNHEMWRLGHKRGLTVLTVTHGIAEAVFMADRVFVMAERPGRMVGSVEVPFGQDRDLTLLSEPAFGEVCGRVRRLLEETGGMNSAG